MKMKRIALALVAASVLATSAVCLTACGGSEADNTVIGGADSATDIVVDSSTTTSLVGTNWKITQMTENGKDVENEMNGASVIFTAEKMMITYGSETDPVDYTFENGVVDAEGIKGTISGNTLTFTNGTRAIVMEKTDGVSVDVPTYSGTQSSTTQSSSLAGTTWDVIEITIDGEEWTKSGLEAEVGTSLDMYFYFTESTVTSYLMGETDTTEYTYKDGIVTIDGESCAVIGDIMEFNVDGQMLKLQKR